MQRFRSSCLIVALALVGALVAHPTSATVPSTMSYQGVLTDGSGNPVPDGSYDLTFSIYAALSGGAPLWTETQPGVAVTKGGFTVILGSVNPLVGATFTSFRFTDPYFLGTAVNGGAELSPRIALTPSPYALALRVPYVARDTSSSALIDVANFGTGADIRAGHLLSLGAAGASFPNPMISIHPSTGGFALASTFGSSGGGSLVLYEENAAGPTIGDITVVAGPAGGGEGGQLVIYGGDDGAVSQFRVNGNESGSGNPSLYVQGTVSTTVINANNAGNASVALPNNAISSPEILDEPGIAQSHLNNAVSIPTGPVMTDLITVSIAMPMPGYIVVEATGQHAIGGDGASQNTASFQIDETEGGGVDANHYVWSGDWPSATGTRYRPISVRRTYFKSTADTYSFRLEANATNPAGATNYLWHPTITATYYPVAYGFVFTGASLAESRAFESAGATAASTVQPGGEGALVDLRDLELKVLRERERLESAEQDLARARQQAVPLPEPRRLDADPKRRTP